MTKREILLKKISAYQFATHDLQLYLNTHPKDKDTLEKMERYRNMVKPLVEEFEDKYGPLTKNADENSNNWAWIKAPWPWESEADC